MILNDDVLRLLRPRKGARVGAHPAGVTRGVQRVPAGEERDERVPGVGVPQADAARPRVAEGAADRLRPPLQAPPHVISHLFRMNHMV